MVKNKNFTIISNNCWGGTIYEDIGIPYQTPIVGLFFYAPCYIKFIAKLKDNIKSELTFINKSQYNKANEIRKSAYYPIGMLNDGIEIHFLHYNSEEDAYVKWTKRKNRINWDRLYFSFSDNESYTYEQLDFFDSLNYPKVFFSSKRFPEFKSVVFIKSRKYREDVGNLYDNRWRYRRYFNVIKWLNKQL